MLGNRDPDKESGSEGGRRARCSSAPGGRRPSTSGRVRVKGGGELAAARHPEVKGLRLAEAMPRVLSYPSPSPW